MSISSSIREKKWIYFFAANDDYLVSGAMIDAGYYSEFFVYVHNRTTHELIEFGESSLFSCGVEIAPSSIEGVSLYWKGNNIIRFSPTEENNENLEIFLNIRNGTHILEGIFDILSYGEPLVNLRDTLPGRMIYTHQNSLMKITGSLTLSRGCVNCAIEFDKNSRGGIDFTLGYHTIETDWYWASAFGTDETGREIAINFAKDINTDSPTATNNIWAYWVGTNIYRNFNKLPSGDWEIKNDLVDLIFIPDAVRRKNTHVGPIGSRYEQPIGNFGGSIYHDNTWVNVNLFGVLEEHYAYW